MVILNWNGFEDTRRCVGNVLAQAYPAFRAVVVDNGSGDRSPVRLLRWAAERGVEVAAYARPEGEAGGVEAAERALAGLPGSRTLVVVENGANLGFAAGTNVGLRYALARGFAAVLVVNNDVDLATDRLARLAATLEAHPTWAAVAPKIVDPSDGRILYAGGRLALWQARAVHLGRGRRDGPRWSGVRETGHVTAGCALYRSSFLRQAGLFDEDFFFGHEDAALSTVARRSGWRLGVDLECVVTHREGSSLVDRPAASVYYFNKYRLVLLGKHASAPEKAAAFAFLAVTRPPKLALRWLSGRADLARAEASAFVDWMGGRLAADDRRRAAREGA